MTTPAPTAEIGINPLTSDRRLSEGAIANVGTITYGMVVIGDTSSSDSRRVCLPAGAGDKGVRGVVSEWGDPNNSGLFDTNSEIGVCTEGIVEVLLDAGQIATKDAPAITGTTPGTVKPVASESAPYDIVGQFAQTYDNSGGASPVLVALKMGIYRRFS